MGTIVLTLKLWCFDVFTFEPIGTGTVVDYSDIVSLLSWASSYWNEAYWESEVGFCCILRIYYYLSKIYVNDIIELNGAYEIAISGSDLTEFG